MPPATPPPPPPSGAPLSVRVRAFAAAREASGEGDLVLSVPARAPGRATAADALDALARRSPGWARALADRGALRLAVDRRMAPGGAAAAAGVEIRDGCELSVFPPVSGG